MNITIIQVLLITLMVIIVVYDSMNLQWLIFASSPVLGGFLTGLILGDYKTGLAVGATLQLMSLGIGAYGGASVPDYFTGAVIGTAFAVGNGQGVNAGIAVSVPVSLLAMQLDILYRIINTFFIHRAMRYGNDLKMKKMYTNMLFGIIPLVLSKALPVFIAVTLGKGVITDVLNMLPKWFTGGMSVAGGLLPIVGIAILLRYMPTKENIAFMIVGFVLVAYLKVPMLGVALIGLSAAIISFKSNIRFQSLSKMKVSVPAVGNIEEEDDDDGYED